MEMTTYEAEGEGRMFVPGFRFHPTDEELVLYYLKRRMCRRSLKLDIIVETDVYKFHPQQLPGLCKLNTGDRQWFFFSPKDWKYLNGGRSNRAAPYGYWKATGKDRTIACNSRDVGNKKTLVFYEGRAPSGQRTDWVMYEYTLNQQELKRCPDVHDFFVLYKVFKKSGPGPKNGEQYGAPFREEDWADEDCLDMMGLFVQQGAVKNDGEIVPVNDKESQAQVEHPEIDVEGFINRIADEAVLFQSPDVNDEYALGQSLSVQESQSTLVGEVSGVEQINMPQPLLLKYGVQACTDLTQSGTSQLQFNEAPEVTSAPNADGLQLHVIEEDFLEHFLEMDDLVIEQEFLEDFLGMDDLVGPQPTGQNLDHENPMNFQLDELDGLSELDLFQDAVPFLNDSGFNDQSRPSQSLTSEFERNPDEQDFVSNHYTNHSEVGLAVPGHMYSLDGNVRRMLNSDSQPHSHNFVNEMVSHQPNQLYGSNQSYEQQYSIFAPAEANDRANPLTTPGMVYNVTSGSNPTGLNQNQNVKLDDASGSWFSSALWAFIDSIPTKPASAAETVLVNKALEKMSSFSRLRITSKNMNYVAGNTSLDSKYAKSRNGLVCFFIVGALCATMFVFIGTSSKVLSRFIFS